MTTKPSLFWVEPGELSRLLERAGGSDVRYSQPAQVPPSAIPVAPAAEFRAARDPRVLPPEEARSPAAPPHTFQPPPGALEAKLTALFDWIRLVVDFDHAFVVDEDGLALVHESAPLELIAASSTMAETWDALRNRFGLATTNSLSLGLMDNQRLHLLTKTTRWGRLSLGIVLETLLSEDKLATINEQFRRTLAEQEHDQP